MEDMLFKSNCYMVSEANLNVHVSWNTLEMMYTHTGYTLYFVLQES